MPTTCTSTQRAPDTAFFTHSDNIVLEVLYRHVNDAETKDDGHEFDQTRTPARDASALKLLANLNDPKSPHFEQTVFCSWDHEINSFQSLQNIHEKVLWRDVKWARTVARHETDVCDIPLLRLPPPPWYFAYHLYWMVLRELYINDAQSYS
ncbi:hypothetical protein LHYA1_G008706 [Lachnellula hyalina]|uniref:Uncharacterized protein n=1 Tax=Lachnellula hyalina TaxID=1316788 RepID=A0A8H8TUP2_9HELO|nr:uncharacterized protein LHYA1_G008706 [Lachnellula hyalina]TVY23019.1 hypothetical protein LHYA1_G008706 [Lachnellula hyalina]